MSNPRPCAVCRSPKSAHGYPEVYVPAKRTEPLRAKRGPSVHTAGLRAFLVSEASAIDRTRPTSRGGFPAESAYVDGVLDGLEKVWAWIRTAT